MAQLQYDISVIGREKLKRALGGVERDLKAHAQRAEGVAQRARRGATGGGAGTRGTAAAKKQTMDAMRGLAQIGAVAAKEEVKIHRKKMANIEKEKRAGIRAEAARARAAEQGAKRAHRARAKFATGIAAGTAGRASNVIRGGASMAGMAGGAMAAYALKSQVDAERSATQLANVQFGAEGGARSRGDIRKQIMGGANKFSAASGIGRDKIVAAQKAYQEKSGRLAGDAELQRMVKLHETTGADMTDLGRAGGELSQSFKDSGVSDPKKRGAMVKRMLGKLSASSGVGQIGFEGMVGEIGKITSVAGRKGADPEKAMAEALGLMQFSVQGGATDAAEAGTAMARFSDMLIKKSKPLGKSKAAGGLGVQTFKDGEMRSDKAVLLDILEATGGDLRKITGAGVDIRAMKIAEAPAKLYRQALKSGKTDAEARDIVQKKLGTLEGGGFSGQELDRSSRFARGTASSKMAQTMQKFNQEVGTKLLPVLTDALPTFAKGIQHAADALKWFVDNPMQGVGLAIVASVTADIAKAGIGKAVSSALTGAVSGSDGKGATGGGKGAAAMIGLAIGAAIAAAIYDRGTKAFDESEERSKKTGSLKKRIAGGKMTRQEAAIAIAEEEGKINQKAKDDASTSSWSRYAGIALTGGGSLLAEHMTGMTPADIYSRATGQGNVEEKTRRATLDEAKAAAAQIDDAKVMASRQAEATAIDSTAGKMAKLGSSLDTLKKNLDSVKAPDRSGKPVVE